MKSVYLLQICFIFSLGHSTSHALPRIITHNPAHTPVQKLAPGTTPTSLTASTESGILAGIWNKVSHVFSRQAPSPDNVFDLDEKGNRKFHVAKLRESPNYARLKTLDVYRIDNDNKHKRSDDTDLSLTETADNGVTELSEERTTDDNDISDNEDNHWSTDSSDSQLRQKRQGISNIAKILERAILASLDNATGEMSTSLPGNHQNSYSHNVSEQFLNELASDILKVKEKADKRDKEMVAENRELNKSTNITKVNEAGKVYEEDAKNTREKSSEQRIRNDHEHDHSTPSSNPKRSVRIERGRLNQRKSNDDTSTEDNSERVDELPADVVTLDEEQIPTE